MLQKDNVAMFFFLKCSIFRVFFFIYIFERILSFEKEFVVENKTKQGVVEDIHKE